MKTKYSFLKVLRAQWSWKGTRDNWLRSGVIAFVWALLYFYLGTVTDKTTGVVIEQSITEHWQLFLFLFVVEFLWIEFLWNTLKLLILGSALAFVTYYANKGEEEAVEMYEEALTWRK